MCGCSTHQSRPSQTASIDPNALAFKVDDMSCGHCAGTIKAAVERGLPGTSVQADPSTKVVQVRGAANAATVRALITAAGYNPVPA